MDLASEHVVEGVNRASFAHPRPFFALAANILRTWCAASLERIGQRRSSLKTGEIGQASWQWLPLPEKEDEMPQE